AEPIGKDCIERAKKHIDSAKIEYTNAMISDEIGEVRYYSASILYDIVNAIVSLNNTCIKFGVKRYLEELSKYEYLPENFEKNYMAVIDSKIVEELRENSLVLLKNLEHLYNKMYTQFIDKPKPTATNLKGTYEELWCNCRNKIITSIDLNDKNYAFQAALSAQHYLNEIAKNIGTPKFDLLKHFDSDNLQVFKNVFLQAMDSYLSEYNKASLKVEKFNTFEELYENFIIRTKNND
ncbi:MAG: hypothetical protein FWD82_05450, partial [Defluviitaleaceae bacterium]|nr:hypothetical protein [Defluviitaleaceae bacterium]